MRTFTHTDKCQIVCFLGIQNELTAFTLIQFVNAMDIIASNGMEELLPLTKPYFHLFIHWWINRYIYSWIISISFAN